MDNLNKPKRFTLLLSGAWNSIHPALQHTATGDALLGNVFDPLVKIGNNGEILPAGASSWEMLDGGTKIRFKINSQMTFSDGTPLTSNHFKQAWENGLSLNSISANQSQLDVLYLTKDFSLFEKTKKLKGVLTPTPDTLEIEFSKPFRQAIFNLSGVRYAAWIQKNNTILGTGPFIIHKSENNIVELLPRDPHGVKIQVLAEPILEKDPNIQYDAIGRIFSHDLKNIKVQKWKALKQAIGPEGLQLVAELNSNHHGIFSNKNLRKAFQYVVWKNKDALISSFGSSHLVRYDPQSLLPLTPGRIENSEALKIISEGEAYLGELKKATAQKPLIVYYKQDISPLVAALQKDGISISDQSGRGNATNWYDYYYRNFSYDVLFGQFSILAADPDELYHVLGKNGAIQNPSSFNKDVGEMLELGRSLFDPKQVNEHYQNVSRKILEEAPYVHLGFSKAVVLYDQTKLIFDELNLTRAFHDFTRYDIR